MAWFDAWRRWFGRGGDKADAPAPSDVPAPREKEPVSPSPDVPTSTSGRRLPTPLPRIVAQDNPWGVPLLDLRPVTHGLVATSGDPLMATNAVSYGAEDGRCFIGQLPPDEQIIEAGLRYPTDGPVADGVLFNPPDMDHKWALYLHQGKILCIRSWQRRVIATADVRWEDGILVVGPIRGALTGDPDPAWTVRAFDFLMRTHVLGEPWPTPTPAPADGDEERYAIAMFSLFGRRAEVAVFGELPDHAPTTPLRSYSLLHIAVACGDIDGARAHIVSGTPADILAQDGLPPLQWALARAGTEMLAALIDLGANVDGRSAEGATALMTASQNDRADAVAYLLERGADPNARDARGLTALHRAAETGYVENVRLLLAHGADPTADAMGHTARSFAQRRGHDAILRLLDGVGA